MLTTTEIVDYCPGDKDTIVLYTESLELYDRFSKSEKCLRAIPYIRKTTGEMVGADLFFLKEYKRELRKRLERLGIK